MLQIGPLVRIDVGADIGDVEYSTTLICSGRRAIHYGN